VLGCSGGIGVGRHTTALGLDGDVLIDCGSGVGELSGAQMGALRHVFLTHSHLDHIAFLPLLVDSVFERLERPLTVHALPQTIQALRHHIFNWVVWPDFTRLPTPDDPVLAFRPMEPGEVVELEGGRTVEMIPVAHTPTTPSGTRSMPATASISSSSNAPSRSNRPPLPASRATTARAASPTTWANCVTVRASSSAT